MTQPDRLTDTRERRERIYRKRIQSVIERQLKAQRARLP